MDIGRKLRAARLQNRVTIAAVSKISGVSKSLISQIERDLSVPTIVTLDKVSKALNIPISTLFTDSPALTPNTASEMTSHKDSSTGNTTLTPSFEANEDIGPKRVTTVLKGQRKKLVLPWGAFYEMLCPDLQRKIELIYLVYPVGVRVEELYSHKGEECGVVLEGKFKGTIGGQEVILEPGDSIYFESSLPHRWENIGETEVKAIWAITPPSF